MKNFCSHLRMHIRCDSEVAWSAVCLHSKSVLSCIDFTILVSIQWAQCFQGQNKVQFYQNYQIFGYKPNLSSCDTCNKAVAVPLKDNGDSSGGVTVLRAAKGYSVSFFPFLVEYL